jgi:hypothetical protein
MGSGISILILICSKARVEHCGLAMHRISCRFNVCWMLLFFKPSIITMTIKTIDYQFADDFTNEHFRF